MWGNKWGNIGETFCYLNPSKPLNPLLRNSSKNPLQPPINTNFPAIFRAAPAHSICDSVGTRTEAWECLYLLGFRGISFLVWGNIWQVCDVAAGEIGAVIEADEAVALAGNGGERADLGGHVLWHVADTMAVSGNYLDGILVVLVRWFGDEGAGELSDVVADVIHVVHPGDGEVQVIAESLVLWPDADMVTFVLYAEVLQVLHLGIVFFGDDVEVHGLCLFLLLVVIPYK